ncbi:MAG: beta-glucanase [Bacteroidaceae bacterium]|nr:beta-glucanase [Bacteroidaceae bacterium]
MTTKLFITALSLMALTLTTTAQQQRNSRDSAAPTTAALPDTAGNHVNAHGGCIIKRDGTWYWYGEARPDRGFTSLGVSLYTSEEPKPEPRMPGMLDGPGMRHRTSFVEGRRWVPRGLVLAVTDSAGSPIERGCIIERPKVLYNRKTQTYVMLFHLELKGRGYEAAQVGFATSKTPEGPFIFHHAQRPNAGRWPADWSQTDIERARSLRPEDYTTWWTDGWRAAVRDGLFVARDLESGQMSRDMTVFNDGRRWWHIYSSEENMTLQAAELTTDCLGYTGRYYRIAPGGQNEAPALFSMHNRIWMICSGCTGWEPNEARMFSADSIAGEWTQHRSPMRGDNEEKTFGAQGAWVVDDGKQLFFLADRWHPRSLSQSRYISPEIRPWDENIPTILHFDPRQ